MSESSRGSSHPAQDRAGIAQTWRMHGPGQAFASVAPTEIAPTRHRRRRLIGAATVLVLTLGLLGLSTVLSSQNPASALVGHPEVLRPGCTWDQSGHYVQDCTVWSTSMQKNITVQIRASNGSAQGVYLLDGARAQDSRSAWTTDVQAAQVYDSSTNTTLVMPAGGASSFYTNWNGPAGANTTIKQETFLTQELPDYLADNFGVSKSGNAIVGLSMSAGPAVTLAEKHPKQFKVVQAMSGYYQTNNPIGALGIWAAQTVVSNYTNGIVNMWGPPGSSQWAANDPSQNVNKLKQNGQVLIISSGNGFLTPQEMAHLSPQDQISAMGLEMLSAVSTVLMQLQLGQSGASVISLPNYGGHDWDNWSRGLSGGRDDLLAALRANPPVEQKTQVVADTGTANTLGVTQATAQARQAAALTVALPTHLVPSISASAARSSSAASSSPASSSSATSSSSSTATTSSDSGESATSDAPSADSSTTTTPSTETTTTTPVP